MTETAHDDRSRCKSGMYRIDAETRQRVVAGQVFPPGYVVAVLDGERAASREGFFTEIARELSFPDYFGRNWDAVYDCLTDPSWLPAEGLVLVFDGFGALASSAPEQWQIGRNVLGEACRFWQPLRRPMFVLLAGPGELAQDVPELPDACLPA
jgi:RNAse (barnase) inhibitor barstar